jgi:multidrug efflux pump subunit AcrB
VTLSFNLAPGIALGQAVDAINAAEAQIGHAGERPRRSFQGTAQAFTASLKSRADPRPGRALAVYIVLGMLYESYIHPITILSTLPSAGVGALLALLLFTDRPQRHRAHRHHLLIGIVKKNAIMMIDFAIEASATRGSPEEAIYKACLLRFRPIMMTTMAALFGGLPLALGHGRRVRAAPAARHRHRRAGSSSRRC